MKGQFQNLILMFQDLGLHTKVISISLFYKRLTFFAFFSLLVISFFPSGVYGQTSYTWNGSKSGIWDNAGNWTPRGVPVAGDDITMVAASFGPTLPGSLSFNNVTVSNGSFLLGNYTLTITGTANFSGGTVQSGSININSPAGTCTFGATVFYVPITGSAASVLLNGATFHNTLTIN